MFVLTMTVNQATQTEHENGKLSSWSTFFSQCEKLLHANWGEEKEVGGGAGGSTVKCHLSKTFIALCLVIIEIAICFEM